MDLKLKGKKALVTGASRGLGYAVARALAGEGATLAINSRTPANIEAAAKMIANETGVPVYPLSGDLGDEKVPAKLVEDAVKVMGGLDILITNAGGPPSAAFQDLDDEAWAKAVDLSLMSHVRLIRAALPHLEQSKAASVLTVTSISVKQPIPNLVLSNSIATQPWG
jgi:3-oxoacyl-[acyl-carrier protein] reductase